MLVATDSVKAALDYIRPREVTACIYRIVNNMSGKSYVGLTSNFTNRMMHHAAELAAGRHRIKSLQKDFDEGDTFRAEILHHVPVKNFYLRGRENRRLETRYILKFNAIDNGYNTSANFKDPSG